MSERRQPYQRPFVAKAGPRFPSSADGLDHRLRIALRLGNGVVLTARMVEELAVRLGWTAPPAA